MQRGFNSVVLHGHSRFAESEFNDVATSLIPAFNILIYFFRTGVLSYLSPRGSAESVQFSSNAWVWFAARSSSGGRHQAVDLPPDWAHWIARSQSSTYWKRHQTAQTRRGRTQDRGPIEPRSRRDRAAITLLSLGNHLQSIGRQSTKDQDHDRRAIVARSWRKSWLFGSQIKAKLTPIRRGIEATIYAHGIARSTPSNRLHDRLHCPRSLGQFPSLKACISLFCSSTFDRLVKKLSEFRGRS